jgi:hypothetical protein
MAAADEPIRVVIDDAMFAVLVAGGVVQCRGIAVDRPVEIELMLGDIGTPALLKAIEAVCEAASENRPVRLIVGGRSK